MKRNDLVIGSRGAAEKPGEQSAGRHGQHHLASRFYRFGGFSQRKRAPHCSQNFLLRLFEPQAGQIHD